MDSSPALTRAITLIAEKDFQQALEVLNPAIGNDAVDKSLLLARCEALLGLKDWDGALKDANTIVTQLDPKCADAHCLKGRVELAMGKVLDALKSFAAGLRVDREHEGCQAGLKKLNAADGEQMSAQMLKIQFAMEVAKKLQADPVCDQYIKADPTLLERLSDVAKNIVLGQDDVKLAEVMASSDAPMKKCLSHLLGLDLPADTPFSQVAEKLRAEQKQASSNSTMAAADAEAIKAKGNEAYKARRFEEALELYNKAAELDPKEILYLNNIAAVLLERGEYQECLKVTQKALDMRYEVKADFTKVAKVYNRRAACYIKMGDYPSAIDSYNKSLVENNDRHVRALLRETEREWERQQAEAYENPELAEQHRQKGNEFFKNKQYPEAKREYDEAIKRNPRDEKSYSNRAATYMCLLAYPDALKDAEKAIELNPKFVKAWARKGGCHFNMKEYNKALEAYVKGLEIEPTNEECRRGRANVIAATEQLNSSDQVDEEQVARAMADPEIQRILGDPQMQMILQTLQNDPSRIMEYMKDPKISEAIQKLMMSGILRAR